MITSVLVLLPRVRDTFPSHVPLAERHTWSSDSATGSSEEVVATEWERQRNMLGFLYSTPAYWPSLELFGWQDKGQQLLDMTRAGNWQEMPEIITDDMLEKFVPRGTYDTIAQIYRERYGGLTRRITFPVPADPVDDERAAEAIARLQE